MFWIFPSAEVAFVQCCVCQWHLSCKFPNTISLICSLMLRPSLAMHLLIPCNRQKQAGFSCTLEIKVSPEGHKQRSLRICLCAVAQAQLPAVSVEDLCISRLCHGRERGAACSYLMAAALKSFPAGHVRLPSQMTRPAQWQAPPSCLLGAPPGAQAEQCSWHETLRIILVVPILTLGCWEARN